MACGFWREGETRCEAMKGTLVPSHYERETFCRGSCFGGCPTYRLRLLTGRPVEDEAYLAEWLAP